MSHKSPSFSIWCRFVNIVWDQKEGSKQIFEAKQGKHRGIQKFFMEGKADKIIHKHSCTIPLSL